MRGNYFSEDTIAAISSATGGAVALVRVSGTKAREAIRVLLCTEQPEARKATRAALYSVSRQKKIDDVVFVYFPNPKSFTGEDVLEIFIHGSRYIANRVMEELAQIKIRQALPGEFSFRAVRNGKLQVTAAEGIRDLVESTNDEALTLALDKMSGAQAKQVESLAQTLRQLLALAEVGIDFNDQDLDEVSLPRLKNQLNQPLEQLKNLEEGYVRGVRVQDGIRAAIVGLPNAGKSSFFNTLLGEERAIVTASPGTTRDVLREKLTLRGAQTSATFILEDTAGLRESVDPVERIGVERTKRAATEAEMVFWVVDPGQPREQAIEALKQSGAKIACVFGIVTKADLYSNEQKQSTRRWMSAEGVGVQAEVSSLEAKGVSEFTAQALSVAQRLTERKAGEILLTRADHHEAVRSAREALSRAAQATEMDLFSADLRQGLHALAPMIGETPTDDILGTIFSQFCIGK